MTDENTQPEVNTPPAVSAVQVVERISPEDKAVLDSAKHQREMALTNADLAVERGKSADLAHGNIVLRLVIKYKLNNGDVINEDGTITRKQTP